MEQDAKEPATASRSQNVVYVVPHDWASIPLFLAPLIERVDEGDLQLQLLVLVADAESAAAVAATAVRLATTRPLRIIAATSAARASRLLKSTPSQIIVGTPATVLELVRASTVKLETIKAIALAWADSIVVDATSEDAMGTIVAEIPKEAARTIATAELNATVESLIERYARRARRVTASPTTDTTPLSLEYFTSSEASRLVALRRIVDAIDPENAAVFVREDDAAKTVSDLLRSLGYAGPTAAIQVSRGGGAPDMAILFDLPASREELAEAMGSSAKRVIAMIQPRQLSSLRALAAGGRVRPITLPDAGIRARSRDEIIRAELRGVLERGGVSRAVLAIEPLLEEFDGIEIAAAAMELLELERAKPRAAEAAANAPPQAGMVRLFFGVGSRDGLRPAAIVGAIANDAGVQTADIGKIEIKDSHSIVEVSPAAAPIIVEKLSGKSISGRRVIIRPDQDVAPRSSSGPRSREGGSRPPARGGFGGKPERRPPRDGQRKRP